MISLNDELGKMIKWLIYYPRSCLERLRNYMKVSIEIAAFRTDS
jgi:hypothetical protein